MKSQSIMLYGNSPQNNLDEAYRLAIENMVIDNDYDVEHIKKHVKAGTYPNFFFISGEEEITISDTRTMLEFLSKKPAIAGWKAVIINNCDNMNRHAANSILKSLEELHEDSFLILTTTRLSAVLPTIRSRCIKIIVPWERVELCDCVVTYICKFLQQKSDKFDKQEVEKIIQIVSSKTSASSIVNFTRQINLNKAMMISEVLLLYIAYQMANNPTKIMVQKFLELYKLWAMTWRTYPDPQCLAVACFLMAA